MRTPPLAVLFSSALLFAACEQTPVPVLPAASPASPPPGATAPEVAPPPVDSVPTVLSEQDRARDRALAPRAAAIVDAYENGEVRLSSDGKRFVYGSDRDGLAEVYLGSVDRPGETPLAITRGPERALWASFTRDDRYILFLRDEGADENFRIWRAAPDGSSPTLLTPGEKQHRDRPLRPRKKPDLMVYTTHVTTSPGSRLMFQPISGGEPREVYEDPSPARAADVTADGSRVLLLRHISASERVLLEVDAAGGKPSSAGGTPAPRAVRLYPPEGTRANVRRAAYSADGKVVFVATDEGKEGFAVLALDPRTRAPKARWAVDEPRSAAIDGLAVSPRGDRVAVGIDAGDHTEIRILDAAKLTSKRKLDLPLGSGGIDVFTEDGKGLAYGLSTPDRPTDIFVADVATGAPRLLRDDRRAGLDGMSRLTVSIEKVRAHDGLAIPVNVYLPIVAAGQKLPVLAIFHGGPSDSSAIGWNAFARFYTALGYAVVEPNIRGSTGFGRAYEMADDREKRGDAIRDLATVNAWVKAQPWTDASRVIALGASYGGYLTLMALARQPSLWRAGVDLVGVADLETLLRSTDQGIRAALVDEFGDVDKDAALLREWSPLRDQDQITAPLFVYAGQNDPRVPRAQSDQIVAALRRRGVPVEYMVAADEGHSLDRRDNRIELMTRVARFLEDHAKQDQAASSAPRTP
ncbi:MAG TPA: prolyl oligopeptidase family serine peptidase [Polyangiaceae bacterium]